MDAVIIENGEVVNRIVLPEPGERASRVLVGKRRPKERTYRIQRGELVKGTDIQARDWSRTRDYRGFVKATRDTRPVSRE